MSRSPRNSRPAAVSPDGKLIEPVHGFPDLPYPRKVLVDDETLWIDGWTFRIYPITQNTLDWLLFQFGRWNEEDSSLENCQQMLGILEAVESSVHRGG